MTDYLEKLIGAFFKGAERKDKKIKKLEKDLRDAELRANTSKKLEEKKQQEIERLEELLDYTVEFYEEYTEYLRDKLED